MKYNYNVMEKNESSTNICSANSSAIRHSFSLRSLLEDRFKLIHPESKNNSKSPKKITFHNNNKSCDNKNNLIDDIKKYCSEKNLKYEIDISEQKKKYGPNKIFENKKEMTKNCFWRKNQIESYSYKPCLQKEKYYINQSSFYKGKFTPNHNLNFTISDYFNEKKNNIEKFLSPKFHSLKERKKNMIKRLLNICNKVKEENINLKKEVNSAIQFEDSLKKKNKNKKEKSFSIEEIKKEFNFDKNSSDSIEQEKILKNNFEKTKICLDLKCQKYLKEIYSQINYEDNRLNKYVNVHQFSINNHINLRQLKKDFKEISFETLKIKKKFKGINAIEPKNETNNWYKMAKNEINKRKQYFRNFNSAFKISNSRYAKNKYI